MTNNYTNTANITFKKALETWERENDVIRNLDELEDNILNTPYKALFKQIISIKAPLEEFIELYITKRTGCKDIIIEKYDELEDKINDSKLIDPKLIYFGTFFENAKKQEKFEKFIEDLPDAYPVDFNRVKENFSLINTLYKEIGDFFAYKRYLASIYLNAIDNGEAENFMKDFASILIHEDEAKYNKRKFKDLVLRYERKWPKAIYHKNTNTSINFSELKEDYIQNLIKRIIDWNEEILNNQDNGNGGKGLSKIIRLIKGKGEERKVDFDTLALIESNLYKLGQWTKSNSLIDNSLIANIESLYREVTEQLERYGVNPAEEREKIKNRPIEKILSLLRKTKNSAELSRKVSSI